MVLAHHFTFKWVNMQMSFCEWDDGFEGLWPVLSQLRLWKLVKVEEHYVN